MNKYMHTWLYVWANLFMHEQSNWWTHEWMYVHRLMNEPINKFMNESNNGWKIAWTHERIN